MTVDNIIPLAMGIFHGRAGPFFKMSCYCRQDFFLIYLIYIFIDGHTIWQSAIITKY